MLRYIYIWCTIWCVMPKLNMSVVIAYESIRSLTVFVSKLSLPQFFPHKSRSFVAEHQAYGTSQSHHHVWVCLIRIHKILIILSTSKHLRDHDHREHFKAPSLSISMPSPNQSALTSGEWDRSQHSKQASHLLHQEPLLQQSWPWHSLPRGSRWGFDTWLCQGLSETRLPQNPVVYNLLVLSREWGNDP